MSEFYTHIVQIDRVVAHNSMPGSKGADALEVALVLGNYPVVVKKGEFRPGDTALYLSVDAMPPTDDPLFAFLDGKPGDDGRPRHRLKAKRLRGVFSQGLLVRGDGRAWELGQDLAEALAIKKWEPEMALQSGSHGLPDLGLMPKYDVEGLKRYPDLFVPGEEVVFTEKLHGANGRAIWSSRHEGFSLASRTRYLAESEKDIWWRAARKFGLAERLKPVPDVALYFEVLNVQPKFHYGNPPGELGIAVFDAMETRMGRFLEPDELRAFLGRLGLPGVPELYRGPWIGFEHAKGFAEGKSALTDRHIREGIVIKPARERACEAIGRAILKLHSETFLIEN